MKTKLSLLIAFLIIIPLIFLGCKAQFEERIAELEEQLAEEEDETSQKKLSEVEEEEEAATAVVTDTKDTEEEATEEEVAEEEEPEEEEVEVDGEAPTISLAIFEGPTLDGGICYYRVEATVTGSPNPTVSFSKDDSGGAWGANKTQINLNDPSDTYTLTATATNSEGSSTANIDLSWGCEVPETEPKIDPGPEPDPPGGPEEKTIDINADTELSGYAEVGRGVYQGSNPFVGNIGTNKPMIAFLSFDISSISSLDDVAIKDVSVSIPLFGPFGNPEQLGPASIYVFYYGNSLDDTDSWFGGELVKTINITESTADFDFSSSALKDELQKRVDSSKWSFQLKIIFHNPTNDDNESVYYAIFVSSVILHVRYETPG